MNKIYKVIWSKVKNCYIVVSELAKRVSRSSSPARAGRASLAAVMAATALTVGTIGMDTAQAATSGAVTQANYIALATHDSNGNPAVIPDSIKNGGNYRLVTATVTDAAGNPVYDGNNKMTRTYYVLNGYDVIVHREEQVIDGPNPTYENVIAEVVKNGDPIPSNSTLTSAQSIISPIVDGISNDKVRTVLGTSLNSIGMSTYSAATNGGIDAKDTWQYIIEDSNSRWVDVNSNDNNAKKVQVTYNTTDKRYHYTTGTGNSAVDHIVYDEESIYYLSDGNTTNPYVFLRSDGTMYTGTVRGLHNEILMTAVENKDGKVMYTYWGAKLNDDETLVKDSDVTVGDLNKAFRTFEANDKNLAQADIANIKLTQQSNGNGGTLGLTRGNDADVLGNVTISSTGGTNGQDIKVQFTNTGVKRATQADVTASGGTINLGDYISDPSNVTTFTVDAGSKVVANGGAAHTQGAKLNTLSINGKTYSIVDTNTRNTVSAGNNVNISTSTNADGTTNYQINATDTDTNNYVTSGSVSYANNGNGTLTLDRQGMADVTIRGLQNTYTTGTTIDGNNVKFNRNDGSSYSVNFTAGGGNGSDTYVQVGGNNGIKLNTGSKVVANSGNATQTLNTISINGTSYSLAGGLSIADIGTGYPLERDEEGNVITADETDRHGWTLADTTNPNKFFKDTTLVAGEVGKDIFVDGSEGDDEDIPAERDLIISDTAGNDVILKDVARNSDMLRVAEDVTTNTQNITNLTTRVETNETNIATNTTNITNLSKDVATNTTNIATNKTSIENLTTTVNNNSSQISTNTQNIATNTTNITTNTNDIAAIKDSYVKTASSDGTTLTLTQTGNNGETITFTDTRNDTFVGGAVAGNEATVTLTDTKGKSLTATITNISSKTELDALDGRVTTNTTNITDLTSRVSTNETNISTNTTNIATNKTSIENLTTTVNNNSSQISTNTQNITNLSEKVTTNTTNIATNTQNITNLGSRVTTNEKNIATNTQNITNLTETVYAGWDAQINGTTAKNVNPDSNTLNFVAKQNGNVTIETNANGDIIFSAIDTDTNTYTTGVTVDKANNNVNFVRNDGQSFGIKFEAGGGTYNSTTKKYEDTFVQIGGANGLTLNTGSKVVGTGVETPDGNATALSGITINGKDFLVPTITANTGSSTEAPYLTSIKLNGQTYNILSQGAAKDLTIKAGTYTVADGTVTMDTVDSLTGNVTQGNVIINGVASVTQLTALKNEINTNISNHKGSTLVNSTAGLGFSNGELTMSVADTGDNSVTGKVNIGGYVSDKIKAEAAGATFGDTTIGGAITTNTTNITKNAADIATNVTNITKNAADIATNTMNIATNVTNITSNTSRIETIENTYVKDITQKGNSLIITQGSNEKTFEFTDTNTTNKTLTNAWNNNTVTLTLTDSEGKQVSTTIDNIAQADDLTALENRVSTNETNISNIQGDITNIQGDITNIQGDITDLGDRITTVEGDITNIKTELEKKIDGLTDTQLKDGGLAFDKANGDLSMTVTDTSGNTVTGTVNIDEYVSDKIDAEAAGATFGDTTIGEAISTNKADIATNKEAIEQNAKDIAQNKADIATNASNIAQNKADIAQNKTDIATNASNIAQNKADIATNAENIASNTDRITTIENTYVKDITQNGNTLTITQGDTTKEFKFTDTDTTNKTLTNAWNGDDVTLTLTDTEDNVVDTTIKDVAKASDLDKEIVDRQEADDALNTRINSEEKARQDADKALDDKIVAETNERVKADDALNTRINTEESERKAADDALNTKIDKETADRIAADEAEAKARQEADKALSDRIDSEEKARQDADTALNERINNEESERKAADDALNTKIDKETADRIAADEAEAKARQDADKALSDRIDSEEKARQDADDALNTRIDNEEAIREATDKALSDRIDNEASIRAEADEALNDRIDTEEDIREAADKALNTRIDDEEAVRAEADKALNDRIDKEASIRETADKALSDRIDKEVSDLEAADDALSKRIDEEEAIRKATDDALNTRIDDEAKLRETVDNALNDRIDNEALIRETVDNALNTRIENEEDIREAADTALNDRIDNEEAIREAADKAEADARKAADDAEAKARQEADSALSDRIDSEEKARQDADKALDDKIIAETNERVKADTALNERIDNEQTERVNADTALNSRIDQEIIDRQNNDIVAGAIDRETGTVTLTKGNGDPITLDGNLCDSRLDNVTYDEDEGKLTFTVTDHYNQDKQTKLEVDGIASEKALEKETSERQAMDNAIINDYTQRTDALSGQVNSLGHRMTKAVAGAAALAALHPLDFDPDDKLSFSAGVGNYGGSTAAAIGAFYRPNERVMFSIGGTVGNGEDMVNAGVSFALGKGGKVNASRVAAVHEINELRQQVAYLSAVVAQMAEQTGYQFTDMKPFPDTPENHWAYEYIAKLAAEGIVEGYPNGNFDGDRTMTRYEFAAMLFHALEKGITLDTKIIDEFEPELGRLSVERIKGEQNQKEKIERVRLNNTAPDRDAYGGKINVGKNWP